MLLFKVIVVSSALASTACGAAETPASSPGPRAGAEKTPRLDAPGSVLILNCGKTDQGRTLTLSALSVSNGGKVASATVPTIEDGGPSNVCVDPLSGYYPTAQALQQLFNSGYRQVAGWKPGPGDKGFLAVAFDLKTGAPLGPGLKDDAFAASPNDGRPVFHGGRLWYVDRANHLRSRTPDQAPEAAQDHGAADEPKAEVAFGGDKPWYGHQIETVAVHPSARFAAEIDPFWGTLQIRKRGADKSTAAVLSHGTALGAPEPSAGGVDLPSCRPNFWLDDRTLICSSKSQIWRVSLSPDLQRTTKADALLPETDQETYGAVLAPDRKAIAFLSEQGDAIAVYRQQLSPGARPTKVADLPASDTNYLVAWN